MTTVYSANHYFGVKVSEAGSMSILQSGASGSPADLHVVYTSALHEVSGEAIAAMLECELDALIRKYKFFGLYECDIDSILIKKSGEPHTAGAE